MFDDGTTKSMAVRLSFSAPDRTLAMDEIQAHIDSILASLKEIGVELKQ